jgi:hypothetical protein
MNFKDNFMVIAIDCYAYDTNMEWLSSFSNYNPEPITCNSGNDLCYVKSLLNS